MFHSGRGDPLRIRAQGLCSTNYDTSISGLPHRFESGPVVVWSADPPRRQLDPKALGRVAYLLGNGRMLVIGHLQVAEATRPGNGLCKQLKALRIPLRRLEINARQFATGMRKAVDEPCCNWIIPNDHDDRGGWGSGSRR